MNDNYAESETSSPGDEYERKLARKRSETFRDFKGITCVFFGFHGLGFAILLCGGMFLERPAKMDVLGAAIVAWVASTFLAFVQFMVAISNASILRWWMIALGVLPWMIIATEMFLLLVAIVLF